MQHRIFLVPPSGDADRGRRHWEHRHGDLFVRTPGLLGYRQNRPVAEQWARGTARFCSETWFADRESERRAYASAYYRDVVTPDEAVFLVRDQAWTAAVLEGPESALQPPDGGAAVLWFDESPPRGMSWDSWELAVPVPPPGRGKRLYTTVVADVGRALTLGADAGPVALVVRPRDYPTTG
ncbi:hypothetical protein FB384_004512 [Prauserella sediminis]|uniref:EthD domain-containing protein n=1 Tax=Prauserella sediminis TaxID=577680 RepID=A0A839XVZ6_9PSEU|nr:EthD domain-containing protein [Prauserella sediminis]MBB3665554.1 hypothetical protein [Prauserella sediminis]